MEMACLVRCCSQWLVSRVGATPLVRLMMDGHQLDRGDAVSFAIASRVEVARVGERMGNHA